MKELANIRNLNQRNKFLILCQKTPFVIHWLINVDFILFVNQYICSGMMRK